ncbi:MAG: 50S ribosomal protein L10 [Desulfatiglandaceae bacterium]|jgi:large subunit ribosomal protein L10
MNREEKKALVADFYSRFSKAKGTFLVDYQGLNVEAMNRLRKELRDVDAEFQVVKNRLLKLACKETHAASLEAHMIGPSAVALTYDDVIASAKVLANFSKEFKQLQIKVGQISGKRIDAEAIRRLAELPGRDVLLAQVLSAMQGVPASFVRVLNGLIVKLLYVLKAIEEEKAN